jgi:hypothetical protein
MVLGFLKKKKEKDDFPAEITTELPEDLERFRTRAEPMPPRDDFSRPMEFGPEKKIDGQDKMDLILQKLETIDVRLKLLEEKLGV